MNEYYTRIEMIGDQGQLSQLRTELFEHFPEERLMEVLEKEEANEIRMNGIDYFKSRMVRFSDKNNGYYYLRLPVWEPIVGPEANVDLRVISERHQDIWIATRCRPDNELLAEISRKYPDVVFYHHMNREHMIEKCVSVIVYGDIKQLYETSLDTTSEYGITVTNTRAIEVFGERRLRIRYERLDENGNWETVPRSQFDYDC
jgi:hypothetical protein